MGDTPRVDGEALGHGRPFFKITRLAYDERPGRMIGVGPWIITIGRVGR